MTISETIETDDVAQQDNLDMFKEVAKKFVESIITQAKEEVAIKLKLNNTSGSVTLDTIPIISVQPTRAPEIHIDLVGSNATSPDDSLIPWASNSEQRATDDESGDFNTDVTRDTSDEANDVNSDLHEKRRQELHSFALEYVKDIIARATALALERQQARASLRAEASLTFQTGSSKVHADTWYVRLRSMLNRLMRNTCFCKTKDSSPTDL